MSDPPVSVRERGVPEGEEEAVDACAHTADSLEGGESWVGWAFSCLRFRRGGCRVGVLDWAGLTVDEGCDETPVGCYVCFAPFYEMFFSCGIFLVEEIFYRSHHAFDHFADLFLLKGGFYHQIADLMEEADLFLGQTGIVLARRTNRVDF